MNTQCPSCLKKNDRQDSQCCSCGYQFSKEQNLAIIKPIRRTPKIQVSVLIVLYVDITGSTGYFSAGVPLATKLILEPINAKAKETKVYLFTGGDLDFNQECRLLCDGVPAEEAIRVVKSLTFDGGGDADETHIDSTETVLNLTPWEDGRNWRNAFILFTTADSKPARSGVTARQIGNALKTKGIMTYLVAEDVPFAQELSDASSGLFFPITNNPDPLQMAQIAAGISQSILMTATKTTQVMPADNFTNNVIDIGK